MITDTSITQVCATCAQCPSYEAYEGDSQGRGFCTFLNKAIQTQPNQDDAINVMEHVIVGFDSEEKDYDEDFKPYPVRIKDISLFLPPDKVNDQGVMEALQHYESELVGWEFSEWELASDRTIIAWL